MNTEFTEEQKKIIHDIAEKYKDKLSFKLDPRVAAFMERMKDPEQREYFEKQCRNFLSPGTADLITNK